MVDTRSVSSGKRSRDPVVPASRLDLRLHATAINSSLPDVPASTEAMRPTPASSSTTARVAASGSSLNPAIAVCSVHSAGAVPAGPAEREVLLRLRTARLESTFRGHADPREHAAVFSVQYLLRAHRPKSVANR